MRHVEVLSVSDDGSYVLLAGSADAERPTHRLRIDDRLLAAVRGELDGGSRRTSTLPPREIQARLRAGESAAEVAKVPLARVLRYAGPVDSERERILDQARSARVRRPRAGLSDLTLGAAVTRRLAATAGLRPDTVAWAARRRDDGAWVVELGWSARGGARRATWLWSPTDGDLVALDVAASRMLGAPAAPAPAAASTRTPASPRPARPATAARAAAQPSTAGRVGRRTARPAALAQDPATASPSARPKRAAVTRAAARRTPQAAAAAPPVPRSTPPRSGPRPDTRASVAPRESGSSDRKGGRVAVPSWTDVLFGVAPTGEPADAPATPARAPRRAAARRSTGQARRRT